MKRTIGMVLGAAAGVAFAATVGAGTAQAGPENCVVTLQLTGASAMCHDPDAPPGREYTVVVDCVGFSAALAPRPYAGFGPYSGGWGGSFGPEGQGSASCMGPLSVGIANGAHVSTYRE